MHIKFSNKGQEYTIEKLLNIKRLLGEENNFNILVFFNDFILKIMRKKQIIIW